MVRLLGHAGASTEWNITVLFCVNMKRRISVNCEVKQLLKIPENKIIKQSI